MDVDIVHLQNLTKLKTLVLTGCIRVKSTSLIRLVQACPYLRHLNIDNTKLIDNKGAIEIAKYGKNLHEFSARNASVISRETYDWIKQYRPQISFIIGTNNDMVTELTGNRHFLSGKLRTHFHKPY